MVGGVPKVGQLQNAAWNLTDVCRFKTLPVPSSTTSSSIEGKTRSEASSSGLVPHID